MGAGSSKDHGAFEVSPGGAGYASGRAVSAAITDRIRQVVAEGSAYTHSQLRRHFAYDRLLARCFDRDPDRWVLKGALRISAGSRGDCREL